MEIGRVLEFFDVRLERQDGIIHQNMSQTIRDVLALQKMCLAGNIGLSSELAFDTVQGFAISGSKDPGMGPGRYGTRKAHTAVESNRDDACKVHHQSHENKLPVQEIPELTRSH